MDFDETLFHIYKTLKNGFTPTSKMKKNFNILHRIELQLYKLYNIFILKHNS